MSYYTTIPPLFQRQNMNNGKTPEQHHTQVLFGDFSILLKLNRYLRTILQGINQSVIVVDGNMVNHSVPLLFVKLDGRCFKFGQFKEHTADGNRLGIPFLALGCEAFELFLFGTEAVGEVTATRDGDRVTRQKQPSDAQRLCDGGGQKPKSVASATQ